MNNELSAQITEAQTQIQQLKTEIHKKVIGQEQLVETLLIGLFAQWHVLLEGVPWVAKTLTVDTMSQALNLDFQRIQFTPDLLPSDVVWTQIYNIGKNSFETKLWPLFTNFVLADEINRAPSKVQSALLEAMAERQITLWDQSYKLPNPFIVLATQNPIEQSWTYKLPEAELDRFLLKAYVDYPSQEEETEIIRTILEREQAETAKILTQDEVISIQNLCSQIHVSENIYNYVADIVFATREPESHWLKIGKYLNYWVSPRGSIALVKCSQVVALMAGRDFVIPEDIKKIAKATISHRLVLSYEALAENIIAEDLVDLVLETVAVR